MADDVTKENDCPLVLDMASSLKYVTKKGVNNKRRLPTDDDVSIFENNVEPQWGNKREQALTVWMNKVMMPPIELDDDKQRQMVNVNEILAAMKKATSDQKAQTTPVPTKEQASLQVYVSQRWMKKLRQDASQLYSSLEPVLSQLDAAVDSRKIIVRKDKAIYQDVGCQKYLLTIMHSIYPLWLRVGLEAVYGKEINHAKTNHDQYGLTCFIIQNMFNDPNLQNEYGFAGITRYYKDGYAAESAKFFIKKFLRLFIFLDRAKSSRLIKHDPCLFYKESQFKCIEDLFKALTTEILSGECNLFKILSQVGCKLQYSQTYVDEVHYFIKNMLTDLRDGVILCRLVELLTDDFTLMQKLRCPPISILQKRHNITVALEVLAAQGVQVNDIPDKKILDGHREKTMTLVYRMMGRFYNIKIGDGAAQLAETFTRFQALCKGFLLRKAIKKENERKENVAQHILRDEVVTDLDSSTGTLLDDQSEANLSMDGISVTPSGNSPAVNGGQSEASSVEIEVILHEAPPVLEEVQVDRIRSMDATYTVSPSEDTGNKNLMTTGSGASSLSSLSINDGDIEHEVTPIVQLLVSCTASDQIDGPINPVEEVEIAIAIESKQQAAIKIQALWRGYRLRLWWKAFLERRRIEADEVIAQALVEIERQNKMATIIQAWFRGHMIRRRLDKERKAIAEEKAKQRAAIKIQAFWRGYRCRLWRKAVLKHRLEKEQAATEEIWKTIIETEKRTVAITKIQAWCRGVLVRFKLEKERKALIDENRRQQAAAQIQALWRGYRVRLWWKAFLERRRIEAGKVIAQALVEIERQNKMATIIQAWFRGHMIRHQLKKERMAIAEEKAKQLAAIKIQTAWRGYRCRLQWKPMLDWLLFCNQLELEEEALEATWAVVYQVEKRNVAIIKIQAWCRGVLVRQQLAKEQKALAEEIAKQQAATKIQAFWRGYRCRFWWKGFLKHRLEMEQAATEAIWQTIVETEKRAVAITKIQAWCRGVLARLKLEKERKALIEANRRRAVVTKIQAWYRGIMTRQQLAKERKARVAALELERRQKAALTIQALFRGNIIRRRFEKERIERKAAIKIQSVWRGFRFRNNPNNFVALVEEARLRITAATAAATEEQTIGELTRIGLDFVKRESLTYIRLGLEKLEIASRWSARSCNRLIEEGVVPILFKLIHEMNLGIASQEITYLAVSILLHLAKFDQTRMTIYGIPQWLSKLAKLLSNFQDGRRDDLFTKIALIVIILCQDEDSAGPEIAGNRMAIRKFQTINTTLEKKEARRKEEEKKKFLQERGKVAVVRGACARPVEVNPWDQGTRFTPEWDLTKKPNESITKISAMKWIFHTLNM